MKEMFQHAATTDGITVRVVANYLPEQSRPDDGKWFWVYHIRIENGSHERVQLVSRHWRIADADGRVSHVDGEGVVGEQPVLNPGRSHDYVSGCPLETPFGTMEGFYTFHREDGHPFEVRIPFFPLAAPANAESRAPEARG
ncbi:Co2+/Mg2+ efflux protein ApaG [Erythrobacter sp. LQ02-29]|uniref:Co2+/Mg2+ efflux protein ApaG n=1 Tax=Erythrobacter sp. LQ02-29 TaxID=2920384 RepID=UPI001F4EBFA1|nr:Co2+/Mg2+ efflux protein ApaG [Erythrobacter sp. LQ02-29]MCP9222842.1 Co2+/Mg2+ efflux protein ApaG [Erythrobacter sp. LQ02-29]